MTTLKRAAYGRDPSEENDHESLDAFTSHSVTLPLYPPFGIR